MSSKSETNPISREWAETIQEAVDLYGSEYLIRQLAEEAMEVALAALKVIRASRNETPVGLAHARIDLIEEMGDVLNQIEAVYTLLTPEDQAALRLMRRMKQRRMRRRMRGAAGKEEDDGEHTPPGEPVALDPAGPEP